MKCEDEAILSFYRDVEQISDNVTLIRHIENQQFFVRKISSSSLETVYSRLIELNIAGTPDIHYLVNTGENIITIEEFINGTTLSEYMEEHGTLSPHEAVDIISRLCTILDGLHRADPPIIHRDIKPSNIIIDSDFNVTLIDFDASKCYSSSKNRDTVLMGTADFAAPEQYGFGQSDTRTDIYALGVLLNVLLTGNTPTYNMYEGKLSSVILKCTALNPSERYRNVSQLHRALNRPKPTYIPPGFRTGITWKKAVAVLGYLCIILSCMWMEVQPPKPLWWNIANKTSALLLMLGIVTLAFDYAGICSRLPLARSLNVYVSWFGRLIWFLVSVVVVLTILSVISPIT